MISLPKCACSGVLASSPEIEIAMSNAGVRKGSVDLFLGQPRCLLSVAYDSCWVRSLRDVLGYMIHINFRVSDTKPDDRLMFHDLNSSSQHGDDRISRSNRCSFSAYCP